jgi:hypothetical protein
MRKIFAQGMPELMHYPDKLLMDNLVMLLSDEVCVSHVQREGALLCRLYGDDGNAALNTF